MDRKAVIAFWIIVIATVSFILFLYKVIDMPSEQEKLPTGIERMLEEAEDLVIDKVEPAVVGESKVGETTTTQ